MPVQDVSLFAIFCNVSQTEAILVFLQFSKYHTAIILLQVSKISLSIGYDICFVVALVKTIRIAYIFLDVSAPKKV